jgi:hypothetical protein
MVTFNSRYCGLTVLLFLVEVCIALFVSDRIIRPFVGDVLVVILIYCFLRTFLKLGVVATSFSVFVFACMVEVLQYFNLVERLGWQDNRALVVIIGTTFDWKDMLAYGLGTAITLIWERHKWWRRSPKLDGDRQS